MITILPTELKSELVYAKRNVALRRYLLLVFSLGILLGALLYIANSYATREEVKLKADLASKRTQTASYNETKAKVDTFKANLTAVQNLLKNSPRFSLLLEDLAAVLPSGSYINSLTLTGEDKKPVQVIVTVDSIDKAAIIRNALIQSPRIKTVDIQTVTQNKDEPTFSADLMVAFEEGQAR